MATSTPTEIAATSMATSSHAWARSHPPGRLRFARTVGLAPSLGAISRLTAPLSRQ
jgi:hypothetical protein